MSWFPEPRELGFRLAGRYKRWARLLESEHPATSARLEELAQSLAGKLAKFEVGSYEDVLHHASKTYSVLKCKDHRQCRKARTELDNVFVPTTFMLEIIKAKQLEELQQSIYNVQTQGK